MLAFTNPFDGIIIGFTVDVNGAFHESVVAHTAQITRINPQVLSAEDDAGE